MPMLKSKDIAKKLDIAVTTLQKRDSSEILKAYRTLTNLRSYKVTFL